ncbi:hypothetical protein GCM10007304_17930 [Rhodococcoides trifolii]|uniref:Uncharacterized protein n=1 Tax=Rhodococcoides trifolii TaxID=908250 RepID=A0A917FSG1_9NOCA|nr:hypothetical protein [Rhodococcus trifolii]GGG04233.1 hypothetical protein GCM10007304_17930 [Rhodococcus trifolii]
MTMKVERRHYITRTVTSTSFHGTLPPLGIMREFLMECAELSLPDDATVTTEGKGGGWWALCATVENNDVTDTLYDLQEGIDPLEPGRVEAVVAELMPPAPKPNLATPPPRFQTMEDVPIGIVVRDGNGDVLWRKGGTGERKPGTGALESVLQYSYTSIDGGPYVGRDWRGIEAGHPEMVAPFVTYAELT